MWTLFPASCCKMLQLFSTVYIMEYIMYPRRMKIFSLNTGTKMSVLWKASASSVSNWCSASWSYPSSCLHPSPAHWWRITSSLLVWSQGVLSGRIKNGNSCKLQEKGHWLILCSVCLVELVRLCRTNLGMFQVCWRTDIFPLIILVNLTVLKKICIYWSTYLGAHRQHSPCFI